ncbi:hypothetical protein HH212_22905 [Massilia forsythiae]|uniref:Peptidase S24/S26A/S26B/S26C domain-containing protein n=1 Tax=Massilia forsythiae TaxID=2728020 RepID=A0A7Z2ZUC2_9BURK|nr:hypothetical protein [Massilia forsythiae]QJE02516.1 hypothetical protein HH212_22905 [Massilia forsythiae]
MKSKGKRQANLKAGNAYAYPVQEFLLLVEGLDAAAIAAACEQGGAVEGGVPPAWAGLPNRMSTFLAQAEQAMPPAADDIASASIVAGDFAREQDGRVFARGNAMNARGVRDGDELKTLADVEPCEGDLVILERAGFGRLLRELRFLGGAALLCSGNPEQPAVPLRDGELSQLRVVVPTERGD